MKKSIISLGAMAVLIAMLTSCVSLDDREMTMQERSQVEVLGSVTTTFTSFQFFHIPNQRSLKNKSYAELRRTAQKQYSGDIDIKNITIAGGGSVWEAVFFAAPTLLGAGIGAFVGGFGEETLLFGAMGAGVNLFGNFQKITATGDVVMLNSRVRASQIDQQRMEGALNKAATTLIESIPQDATIAILSIFSDDRSASEYIVEELEYRLIGTRRFYIVDRRRLDQIRREQDFQMSGDVDDNSAVSIGNMLGANIVITGEVSSNRLVLRALDVKTARIIAMAREQL